MIPTFHDLHLHVSTYVAVYRSPGCAIKGHVTQQRCLQLKSFKAHRIHPLFDRMDRPGLVLQSSLGTCRETALVGLYVQFLGVQTPKMSPACKRLVGCWTEAKVCSRLWAGARPVHCLAFSHVEEMITMHLRIILWPALWTAAQDNLGTHANARSPGAHHNRDM